MSVPESRIVRVNDGPVRPDRRFVLYWMTAHRRTTWNFSLDRALEWARELDKPLVVLEPLRLDYPWASARIHAFIIDGMRDNARRFAESNVLYYPYLEPTVGAGSGLLEALGAKASVVVTDDYPAFFLPRMVARAGEKLPVLLEKVDANGLLPIRSTREVFTTAHAFRRFLHRTLLQHIDAAPEADALENTGTPRLTRVPAEIAERWPMAPVSTHSTGDMLATLPVDPTIGAVAYKGGSDAAARVLKRFLTKRLPTYADRNDPGRVATSSLSPYLHFGHIGVHQVFSALARRVDWSPLRVVPEMAGRRAGWWGASEPAEAFLDQIVTWREVGFNMCVNEPAYDQYRSLPAWARQTLAEHARDPREYVYTLEEFETAATHDPLWNAAQMQLLTEGRIHNYLRMLWGKKILEWTKSPEDALEIMTELNNAYALDGRDPNSYSGIFWILGRYDRAWGPERPVFGKVRYMTSENTARKFNVKPYLERYQAPVTSAAG